jgi:membrane peptidoglycan carboxypeptidase
MSRGNGRRNRRSSRSATVTTKSGRTIKVNRSLSDRSKAKKAEREAAKAAYLSTLPKDRWKRIIYRMHPKRVAQYWFSREGAFMALKVIGVSMLACFFLIIGLFAYFRKDLPAIKDISGENLGGSISYYDSTGKTLLWQDYDAVKRIPVNGNQISPYMKEATVAIEDKNFYKEGAFDVRGILRAATHDAFGGGGGIQGGSTITQQLVKLNEGWTDNRTITRKVKELILAVELEREYSKNDILTGYLNIAPYGGIEYGVESAAEDYFHTTAANLTLAQASMLAAIPQSPSYYSPYGSSQYNPSITEDTFNAGALIGRQDYILQQMVTQGYIKQAAANAAEKVNVLAEVQPLQSKYQNIQAPYFVLAAKQELDQTYGASTVDRGGWKVITTLNMGLQQDAEQDVAANTKNVAAVGGDEEAMVAEDTQTGQVVAQVGGENFNDPVDGQIDYAATNLSPGSSMKPFVYAGLIQNNNNVGASSVLYDSQQVLPGYPCTNKTEPTATSNGGNCLWDDDFHYPGPETIRYALAGSRNVPAVKASYEVVPASSSALIGSTPGAITSADVKSVNKWIGMANEAIGTPKAYACYQQGVNLETASTAQQTQCYGSAAIGSGDISLDKEVNGDVTLGRLGQEIPQTYILNITDAAGHTVYQWHQPTGKQVYSPDTAYIVDSMLDDPRASYLQPYQKFQNYNGWDIAVKTGTENQEFNGVMTAWNTQYAVIGFAGYHTLNKPLEEGHFEDITEPITRTWLEQALGALHTKAVNWVAPKNIKSLPGYVQSVSTGFGAEVPGPTTDLYPSWYVGGNGGKSTSQTIDKVSGLTATSCTPALAREVIYSGGSSSWNIDIFKGGLANIGGATSTSVNSNSSASTDDVHNCNDSPPTVTLTAPSTCNLSCSVTATVTQGTHPLSDPQYPEYPGNVEVTLNGNKIYSSDVSDSPSTVSFTYRPSSSGSGTLKAIVTDSVLYQGTASQAFAYTAASPISASLTGQTSTSANIAWSGGNGSFTVTDNNGPAVAGCGANSCTVPLVAGNNAIVVQDSDGDTSNTITVSGT